MQVPDWREHLLDWTRTLVAVVVVGVVGSCS